MSPLRARSNPENIDAVKAEVTADWPMAGLLDMVKEVDLRLGFTDALGSPTAYEALDRTELRSRRLLCLYGLGTNAGLRRLDASRDGPGQREKLRAGVHGQDRGGADVNRAVKWVPAEGAGAEHLSIRSIADGVVAEGVVVGARGGTPYGSRYRVACDARWRVREAVLSLAGKERRLHLRDDGEGNWQDGAGQPVEALRGCVDIDILATPFTKYLADPQARARARRGDETLGGSDDFTEAGRLWRRVGRSLCSWAGACRSGWPRA